MGEKTLIRRVIGESGRVPVRVDIAVDAQLELDAISEHEGMTKVEVCSRLVEWFVSLPPSVQAQVLDADSGRGAAECYLRWVAEGK